MYSRSCNSGRYHKSGTGLLFFLGLFFVLGIFSINVFPIWLVPLIVIWIIKGNQDRNKKSVNLPRSRTNNIEPDKPHVEAYVPITYVDTSTTSSSLYCFECGAAVAKQKYCDSCGLRLNYDA